MLRATSTAQRQAIPVALVPAAHPTVLCSNYGAGNPVDYHPKELECRCNLDSVPQGIRPSVVAINPKETLMTPEQQTRVESVFAELRSSRTHLHHKVTSDLLSGSVKMGKITRRNPPVLKGELEEALSEMYLGLCKLPWPWWWNVNETTANIMACKAVALPQGRHRRGSGKQSQSCLPGWTVQCLL